MIVDQHLDYDVINALKDVMEDDFTFLIETYFHDSLNRIQTLHNALPTMDNDVVRRAAHSFKGSCSNLGALRLASLCGELERNALQENLGSLNRDVKAIEEEFVIVKKLLEEILPQAL